MSKNLAIGVAIVMCLVAAGLGAYIAMRPQTVVISAPEPGVTVADLGQQAPGTQAPPAASGTENVITDPTPVSTSVPASTVPPTATKTPAASKPSTRTMSWPSGKTDAPAPSATSPAPAPSAQAPASGGWTPADKPWPTTNNPATPAPASLPPVEEPVAPPTPPPPPAKQFDELVVSADAVVGLQLDSSVSSEVARVEDPVSAHVTREVRVGSDIAIPSGTKVLGSVVQVEKGGKMKTASRLGVRFHTLVMADGTRLPINTDAIYREGKSPGQESTTKVGAASVGGAILGAIIGGGKGAAIGGAVGAAGGTAAVMVGGRNPVEIKSGTPVTVRLKQPVTVTVERDAVR